MNKKVRNACHCGLKCERRRKCAAPYAVHLSRKVEFPDMPDITRICVACSKSFTVPEWKLKFNPCRFCSKQCFYKGPRLPVAERFWKKVRKTDSCWLWTGSISSFGHGSFNISGRAEVASRMAWILTYGEIPHSMWILHKCDVPACVNPDHLYLGTRDNNLRDAMDRKRLGAKTPLRGSKNPKAKLNDHIVREIRKLYASGNFSQEDIAKQFEISRSTIEMIIQHKRWAHVS